MNSRPRILSRSLLIALCAVCALAACKKESEDSRLSDQAKAEAPTKEVPSPGPSGEDGDKDEAPHEETDDTEKPTPEAKTDTAPPSKPSGPVASDVASNAATNVEVQKASERFVQAWRDRDLKGVMSHIDRNVISIYKGEDDATYADTEDTFKSFFADVPRFTVQYTNDHIWTSPKLAVAQFTLNITMTNKGRPTTEHMRGIDVWRKGKDGNWKIYWNVQYDDVPEKSRGRGTTKPLPTFDINTISDPAQRELAKEVRNASNQLYGGFASADYDAVAEMVGDDALFMVPGEPDSDKAKTLKEIKQVFDMKPVINARTGIEEIVVHDTLAVVRFINTMTIQVKGRKLASTDRGFDVWRKGKDGTWKIISSAQYDHKHR